MENFQVIERTPQRLGEAWIEALLEKDYPRLTQICQPDVRSRLMTPRRIDTFENLSDLTRKVENWFHDCSSFQEEQSRVAMVGEKLAIFYRMGLHRSGEPNSIEQQVYCTLREGLIDQVSLLCSGFQPVQAPVDAPAAPSSIQVDAFLRFDTDGGQGSTCAILTPAIKCKLAEISSGQVLEVQVDDPSAKDDIESWSRLSGNSLLRMDQGAGSELHFYLVKK